jgi:hypothetical protein
MIVAEAATEETSEEEEEQEEFEGRGSREMLNVSMRFKSPTLLAIGSVAGMSGFWIAAAIGAIKFFTLRKDSRSGRPFRSGNGYWPATVSEQVHDWNSAEGRIFFGFCLIAVLLIFQSWYPYELRNVYTGRAKIGVGKWRPMYWITFRQVFPTMGLLMLISVSTVPTSQATGTSWFAVMVHLFGAFLMFVGYMVSELKCLGMCGFKGGKGWEYLDIEPQEFEHRKYLMFFVLIFYVAFCVLQVILIFSDPSWICCDDEYVAAGGEIGIFHSKTAIEEGPVDVLPTMEHLGNATFYYMKLDYLSNTASGPFLFVKIASYLTEVIAGLCVIFSHLVIWYHCEERHVEFAANSLVEVYDEELRREVSSSQAYVPQYAPRSSTVPPPEAAMSTRHAA